jgi:hypothetical protein
MSSSTLIRKLEELDPKTREAFLCVMEEVEEKTRVAAVGRGDFNELKEVVRDLAAAQNRTELRVEELTQAQNRTELRVEELAQAQERTEASVRALTEAQERTEASVRALADDQKDMRKQMGGLAMAVGYGIEDRLIPHLKAFARREFGIEVTLVDRRNVIYPDGAYDEVNLFAEGAKDGRSLFLIGECKAQPGKKDFDRFSKMIQRLQTLLSGEIQPFVVGYHFTTQVEVYADKHYPHIRRYKTFNITESGL